MINEEIRKVIVDAGLTPSHTNLTQLSQAIVLLSPSVAPGAVVHFARTTAPTGWLKANGALVSRSTYSALFAAIGTTFGVGDGSTTFALPDLRGEFARGWDDGRGVDAGRVFGAAQADEFKLHGHSQRGRSNYQTTLGGTTSLADSVMGALTGSTESQGGTETRPRNVALLACIKF